MDLFTAIKDALVTRLRRLPWMDEETQKKSQDRVSQEKETGWGHAGGGIEYWTRRSQWLEESVKGMRVHSKFKQQHAACMP